MKHKPTKFTTSLNNTLEEIRELLTEKNKSYGDAALDPINIFSKGDSLEQIRVRIDDKINRLKHQGEYNNEDTKLDLLGYMILERIAMNNEKDEFNEKYPMIIEGKKVNFIKKKRGK